MRPHLLALLLVGCPRAEVLDPCGVVPADDLDPAGDVVEVELRAGAFAWDPGTGTEAAAKGYGGTIPGPTIVVERGQTLRIRFVNDTDEHQTMHWHGLRVPVAMDGITQMADPVMPGEEFLYEFEIIDTGLYWYHPHMATEEALEAGLYGLIVSREPGERAGSCEIAMAIDDVLLDSEGQIRPPGGTMARVMGRLGNLLLANGKSGRQYEIRRGDTVLLRLVNAANTRTFDLSLEAHSMRIVGTDGGWLETPVDIDRLLLAPGERALVAFDATGEAGGRYAMMNRRVQLHLDSSPMIEEDPLGDGENELFAFVYDDQPGSPEPISAAPDLPALVDGPPSHRFVLDEDMMTGIVSIDGTQWPNVPVVDFPVGGGTFEVENRADMSHPFHLHGNRFQVTLDGMAGPGWKDTVNLLPGEVMTFSSPFDNPGEWMYHCHILEHAELGMAGLYRVQ
jgi:FtsP/CotA-like multicopper oxidase with cupredoxin domain